MSGGQVEVEAEDVDGEVGGDGNARRGSGVAPYSPVDRGKLSGTLGGLVFEGRYQQVGSLDDVTDELGPLLWCDVSGRRDRKERLGGVWPEPGRRRWCAGEGGEVEIFGEQLFVGSSSLSDGEVEAVAENKDGGRHLDSGGAYGPAASRGARGVGVEGGIEEVAGQAGDDRVGPCCK
jgi:hypothetical protein